MSGLALMRRLSEQAPPAVMVTGYADVPLAIEAFRAGAFDFVEKPLSVNTLIGTVERALAEDLRRRAGSDEVADAERRLGRLTERELEVATLLTEGLTSKEIARRLEISHRTVERHRERIYERAGVRHVVALAALLRRYPPRD